MWENLCGDYSNIKKSWGSHSSMAEDSGLWDVTLCCWGVAPDILKECGAFIIRSEVSHLRRPGSLNILIAKLVTSLFFCSIFHTVVNALIVVFVLFRTVVALLLIWNMRLFSCNVLVHRGNVSSKCYIDFITIIAFVTVINGAAITTTTTTTTSTFITIWFCC